MPKDILNACVHATVLTAAEGSHVLHDAEKRSALVLLEGVGIHDHTGYSHESGTR
jgi:hypothetical protein